MTMKEVEQGKIIYTPGQKMEHLYLVMKGFVEVKFAGGSYVLHAGDIIGLCEMAGDEIFLEYNELQKKSGFDLSSYHGKTVKKYVYPVLEEEETFVTLYIYDDRIISADISSHTEGWQRPIDGGKNMG